MFERKLTLLRAQKKRVYEILRETSLEPAEFSWSDERVVDKLVVSKLKHRDGQHYFQFSSCEINAWCIACPGLYRTMEYRYPKSWEEQEDILRQWAASLRSELDTEDPWQELAKYRPALDGGLSAEVINEPISADEADQIAQVLVRLGDEMTREFSLNAEQSLAVRALSGPGLSSPAKPGLGVHGAGCLHDDSDGTVAHGGADGDLVGDDQPCIERVRPTAASKSPGGKVMEPACSWIGQMDRCGMAPTRRPYIAPCRW